MKCCSLKGTDSSNMLAIFWSWTCVENPELCDPKQTSYGTYPNKETPFTVSSHNMFSLPLTTTVTGCSITWHFLSTYNSTSSVQVKKLMKRHSERFLQFSVWPVKLLRRPMATARPAAWASCTAGWGWRSVRGCKLSSRSQVSRIPGSGSAERKASWTPGERRQCTLHQIIKHWEIEGAINIFNLCFRCIPPTAAIRRRT